LRSIRELKIHMRLTRVTRIATLGQLFAGIDMIARPHQHRSTTQMRQCGVAAVAEIKYDVVAKQRFGPPSSRSAPSISRQKRPGHDVRLR
jgi:hypothetical protein